MLRLFTGRVMYERRYKGIGVPFINTTVKIGRKEFAPTWDIVVRVKSGEITEEEYTERYLELMEQSWNDNPKVWAELLQQEGDLILTCFCPENKFCHRHLLVRFIATKAAKQNLSVELAGEYGISKPSFS